MNSSGIGNDLSSLTEESAQTSLNSSGIGMEETQEVSHTWHRYEDDTTRTDSVRYRSGRWGVGEGSDTDSDTDSDDLGGTSPPREFWQRALHGHTNGSISMPTWNGVDDEYLVWNSHLKDWVFEPENWGDGDDGGPTDEDLLDEFGPTALDGRDFVRLSPDRWHNTYISFLENIAGKTTLD